MLGRALAVVRSTEPAGRPDARGARRRPRDADDDAGRRPGRPARHRSTTTDELVDAVREVDDADEPLLVVSGGSNLVVADEGFDGTVVRVATTGITLESADRCGGAVVRVAAGEPWDDVVAHAVDAGLGGRRGAVAGSPGSTGATPIQNVGAYGQEVAETVAQVRIWDRRSRPVRTLRDADCGFTYRHSRFKGDPTRFVVLDVLFQFEVADLSRAGAVCRPGRGSSGSSSARASRSPTPATAVLEQRRRRGMVLDAADHDTWSCGSFFTNPILPAGRSTRSASGSATGSADGAAAAALGPSPTAGVKTSAAWLIEHAGFGKGFGLPGPAALSTKHTLAVTNRGGATAADVARAGAARCATACRRPSGSGWSTSRCSSASTL